MKKTITILWVLAILTMMFSFAASNKVRMGDRLNVFVPATEFPAGITFHIAHGWINPSNVMGIGLFKFSLEVDGNPVEKDFIERSATSGDPDLLTWIWVYNFPEGMTGIHIFTGHWTGPCQGLVDLGVIEGPCVKPNEIMESNTRTSTVTFIP